MAKTPSREEVLSAAPPRVCFRSGPTRYYFFYGGTRHYYGTRTWNQCNGHCDQSVYLDQASWTINAVGGTPPQFSGYETPNQIKRAISAQWIGVNQNLIQVTCSSTTCSVQVMLPDGSSKYQFQSTIQNGCPVDGSGGAAYTSAGVNPGGTVSCSAVSLTRVAVQPESGVRPHHHHHAAPSLLFKPRGIDTHNLSCRRRRYCHQC